MSKYQVLKDVLSKKFMVSQKSNEEEIIIKCPYCGDKSDDYHIKTGHFHLYINVNTGAYHCFLCGKKGHDINQFINENRSKFTNEDILLLSKEYLFQINKKEIFEKGIHIAKLLFLFPLTFLMIVYMLVHDFDKDAAREMGMSLKEYKKLKKQVEHG